MSDNYLNESEINLYPAFNSYDRKPSPWSFAVTSILIISDLYHSKKYYVKTKNEYSAYVILNSKIRWKPWEKSFNRQQKIFYSLQVVNSLNKALPIGF